MIDANGSRYISPYLEFKGTGGEVDAVPMFCDEGHLIHTFFDDPRIRNLEYDNFDRPLGAGQGFVERPWTKDQEYKTPVYGPAELVSFNIYENSIFGPLLVDIPYNVFREILGVTGSSISKSSSRGSFLWEPRPPYRWTLTLTRPVFRTRSLLRQSLA